MQQNKFIVWLDLPLKGKFWIHKLNAQIISGLVGCWNSNEAFLVLVVARITSTDYLSSRLLVVSYCSIPSSAILYHTIPRNTMPGNTRPYHSPFTIHHSASYKTYTTQFHNIKTLAQHSVQKQIFFYLRSDRRNVISSCSHGSNQGNSIRGR